MTVKIYSAVWCPSCKLAKQWLSSRGIEYVERRVDQDPQALQEVAILGDVLPTLVVTDDQGTETVVVGYRPADYERVFPGRTGAKASPWAAIFVAAPIVLIGGVLVHRLRRRRR